MYFFSNTVNAGFEDIVLATRDALRRHGFEVVAEIDMRRTFKKHLAIDFRPYLILCAYDPALARRAVKIDDEIGSVLFCNVIVQQQEDGRIDISAADPACFMYVTNHVELDWIIRDLRGRLQKAVEEVKVRPATRRYPGSAFRLGSRAANAARRHVGHGSLIGPRI